MAVLGRIRHRLALAIVLTALIPVLFAIWLADSTVRQTAARFYLPEIRIHLDRSLGLYSELAHTVKSLMRAEAAAIAERARLRDAAEAGDRARLDAELRAAFGEHPSLVSLAVTSADGRELARVDRGSPVDPTRENRLEVERSLGSDDTDDAPTLVAVFAADRKRFDELSEMNQFLETYATIERRREADQTSYVLAFATLLGITIALAVAVGALLARNVSVRIGELARATKLVAQGDLGIRVPEGGKDEIADLARAFNRMLSEVAESRSRIEYLQRIGAWQEMARRLAHEIKNPLTPIQLAVQEVHRRYDGGDGTYRKLLDSTLEIIEDEVGTLRRLVGEFSEFARLPRAELEREDLSRFLREQQRRLSTQGGEHDASELPAEAALPRPPGVELVFDVPEERADVLIDRQMLRRVLVNLIENGLQAVGGAEGTGRGTVRVRLSREADVYNLDVEDSGPGIPEGLRETVFDPYFTTKHDGTGLGLAIVKKTVIEHGGSISAGESELGGARIRVRLPAYGSSAAALARSAIERHVERGVSVGTGA